VKLFLDTLRQFKILCYSVIFLCTGRRKGRPRRRHSKFHEGIGLRPLKKHQVISVGAVIVVLPGSLPPDEM
jgi:hypothetical protein